MTIQVNIAEAKAKLSELVARAEAGEEVVIARHGRPIVALTPKTPPQTGRRRIGVWEHLNLSIPLSTFHPDPDLEAWLDKPVFPDE
jgi:prevent-host-death family protein